MTITAFGHELHSPLLYVVDRERFRGADASLLCLRQPIAKPHPGYSPGLDYWPQLARFTPQQLWCYVNWLATGRSDPNIELGIVFAFFYGLERRALVDGQDVSAVAAEVLRLNRIYGGSRSFNGYATGLLAQLAMCGRLQLTNEFMATLLELQGPHVAPAVETMYVGTLARDEQPLPAGWALRLAAQHELAKRGVVVNRAPEELSQLFATRYAEQFGSGLVPKRSAQDAKVAYRAASPTLAFPQDGRSVVPPAVWPKVPYWSKQMRPVVTMYNGCLEELRGYARKLKPEGVLTHEAYAQLPPELRAAVIHPKQSAWDVLLAEFAPESGATLIPVSRIAELLDLAQRPKLTLAQSKRLAEFAETLNTPLEPDPRASGSALAWNHHVAVIKLVDDPVLPEGASYTVASLVLRLAMEVATADGALDLPERQAIEAFIDDRFDLSTNDRVRIHALIDVLERDRPGVRGLNKLAKSGLKPEHRAMIGRLLVDVAAVSEGTTESEADVLAKIFRTLELPADLADELLAHSAVGVAATRKAEEALDINLDRIRAIRAESDEAAKVLLEAIQGARARDSFEGEDTGDAEGEPEASDGVGELRGLDGLRGALHPLLTELLTRAEWPPADFAACTRRHGSSPAAALDEINSWADGALGDFLVVEGEPYIIVFFAEMVAWKSD